MSSEKNSQTQAVVPAKIMRSQEISALEQQLKPATRDEIADKLAILFAQFPSQASGDPKLRREGYFYALSSISLEALSAAVRAVLNGETECSLDFMPSAPRLATIARRFQGYTERALVRARNRQAQLDGPGYYLESWMEPPSGSTSIGAEVGKLIEHKGEEGRDGRDRAAA